MKKNISLLLVILCLFAACTPDGGVTNITNVTNIIYKDAEEESMNFVTESLAVYDNGDKISDTMYVRFYDDDRYVPYISVRYFLEAKAGFKLKKSSYADGKYKYLNQANNKDFSMVVDVKADTITCPEMSGFNLKTGESSEETNRIILTILNVFDIFKGQKTQLFDLQSYGMKIYGGLDDAYIPLCVLSQLFITIDYKNYVFDGENIYVIDKDGTARCSKYMNNSWYVNDDGSLATRPTELIDLAYNMICFTHDSLYGCPGYYGFADSGSGYADATIAAAADKLKFDQMLQTYDNETRTLLKSSSYCDYIKGLVRLTRYTYGDSHAGFNGLYYFGRLVNQEQWSDLSDYYSNEKNCSKKIKKRIAIKQELHQKRLNAGKASSPITENDSPVPISLEVLTGGKTAVIRFDTFNYNSQEWGAYYEQDNLVANPDPDLTGDDIIPIPNDTLGMFYRAFYTILNAPEYAAVENILIDLSLNTGGINIACMKGLVYLLGECNWIQYDVHTDTMLYEYITADLNLDGKIDKADTAYYHRLVKLIYTDENGVEKTDGRGLRFAVLTSQASFSCGNYFPIACVDAGIPIIGELSGGGSCSVGAACTVDGFPYQYSTNKRLSYKDGTSVEGGARITKTLTRDKFYNDAALQSMMDELRLLDRTEL